MILSFQGFKIPSFRGELLVLGANHPPWHFHLNCLDQNTSFQERSFPVSSRSVMAWGSKKKSKKDLFNKKWCLSLAFRREGRKKALTHTSFLRKAVQKPDQKLHTSTKVGPYPYKWPYKWVITRVITLLKGDIDTTPFITIVGAHTSPPPVW